MIANLDALAYLRSLADSSVDLVVSDPPYYRVKGEPWDRAWDTAGTFLAWLATVADEWRRVLKPNGSLYCFASPQMAARVEVLLGERFCVLNSLVWTKPMDNQRKPCREALRAYFPATERIVFCEQHGADNAAKGEAGYETACQTAKTSVIGAYLRDEFARAGVTAKQIAALFPSRTGGFTGCVSNWLLGYNMPTAKQYAAMREFVNANGTEHLRKDYEELRRPFAVTADVPYTDVWTFPTVQAGRGKHSCAKPWDMAVHIINASSRPGAVVCDPFCGSGVFLEAAAALGREPIGNDGCKHWADVTRRAVASPRPIGQGRLL